MKLLVAIAAGYVIGARAGGEGVDEVMRSLRAVRDSEEVHDLVCSLRAHLGHTLRELASMVESPASPDDKQAAIEAPVANDLVERVRLLTGRP